MEIFFDSVYTFSMALFFLFDLDGTLVDTRADIANAVNLTRRGLGLAPVSVKFVADNVGGGAGPMLRATVPECADVGKLLAAYLGHYHGHLLDESLPYPGIVDLLEGLKADGHRLAVVTNKSRAASLAILEGLRLMPFFDAVVADGDDVPALKPDPAPLHYAARKLGRELRSADWMVGDMETDLRAGASAGINTCFCCWGFLGSNAPLPATLCASTPCELRAFVKKI